MARLTIGEALTVVEEQVERMFPEGPMQNPQVRCYSRAYTAGARRLASLLEEDSRKSLCEQVRAASIGPNPLIKLIGAFPDFPDDGVTVEALLVAEMEKREQGERIEAAGCVSDKEDDGDAD